MYSSSMSLNLGKQTKQYYELLDKKIKFKRSTIKIKCTATSLTIQINADDPAALLASMNSVLKQIRIIGNAQALFD